MREKIYCESNIAELKERELPATEDEAIKMALKRENVSDLPRAEKFLRNIFLHMQSECLSLEKKLEKGVQVVDD